MNNTQSKASLALLTLILTACGEGAIPFKEIEVGRYAVKIDSTVPTDGDAPGSFPIDSENEGEIPPSEDTYQDLVDAALSETQLEDSASDSDTDDSFDAKEGANKGGSGASKGATGQGSDGKAVSAEDKKTIALCQKLFSGKATKLLMVSPDSSSENLNLDASTVIAARLSGNQQKLNLNISGVERMAGVCIVATGNQPKVTIVSDVDLGQLVYVGRGNQSQSMVLMANGHTLESSYIEVKGNGNTMNLAGVESTHCDNAVIKGNAQNSVTCKSASK